MKRKIANKLDKAIELYKIGDLNNAERIYNDVLRRDHKNDNALRLLGLLENRRGNKIEAIRLIRKAIRINPKIPAYYNNLGEIYRSEQEYDHAMRYYKKAISLNNSYAQAYNNLGCVQQEVGRSKDAINSFQTAISFIENYAEAHNNLGAVFQQLGMVDQAIESFERAININPGYAEAHRNLSTIKEYKPGDTQLDRMNKIVLSPDIGDYERMHLYFAMAKAYDDLGLVDRSFSFLCDANRIRKKVLGYDINRDQKVFEQIKNIFSINKNILDLECGIEDSIRPIFIVGMMRSGTSLVEQILSTHSEVYGAGELEDMGKIIGPQLSSCSDGSLKFENFIRGIHEDYYAVLRELNVSEKIVIDKMPINFLWIGFIISAFPNAKIVHLNRDPVATCWSIYKNYFSGSGNGYAYDMNDLAAYYKLYIDLMVFWKERYSDRIYDLHYESLTENQEQETRKLLDYCGLKWEERCLDFHKTKREVKTVSAIQVRKKMYKGSSEVWKRYKKHLTPLINGLEL